MAFFNLSLQLLLATRDLTAWVSSLQPLLQVWAYRRARLCFGVGPARSLWVKPWMLGADPQVFCQSWFFSNTDPFLHRGIIILSLVRHAGLVFLSAANWLSVSFRHTSGEKLVPQVEFRYLGVLLMSEGENGVEDCVGSPLDKSCAK